VRRGPASFLALALVALAGCSGPPAPPKSPEEAALRLLRMASATEIRRADWAAVAASERIDADPALFATTMAALGAMGTRCRVTGTAPAGGGTRRDADLTCSLPGGGTASLVIASEERPDGTWRVVSIEGPGIGWPSQRPGDGAGVTTSAPP